MKIVKIERLEKGKFEVTVRHNWVERLFGFAREEKRFIRDTGVNWHDGRSIYVDEYGDYLEWPLNEICVAVDNWRKTESLKRGL